MVTAFAVPALSSPAPRELAYAKDGAICIMRADGTGELCLTSSDADSSPIWSPNGKKVAFLRTTEHQMDLWVFDLMQREEAKLADKVGNTFDWSPDGASIAFSSAPDGGPLDQEQPHIHVVDTETGVITQVTNDEARADTEPRWSPDGAVVAFTGTTNGGSFPQSTPNADVHVAYPSSKRVTRLTDGAASDYSPQWSPNGKRIAFISTRDADDTGAGAATSEIYTMRWDGRRERRLTHSPKAHNVDPEFSPDGRRILYIEYVEEEFSQIRLARTDGSSDKALEDAERVDWNPTWSPDGTQIVFASSRKAPAETDTELIRMSIDGARRRVLTDDESFQWTPDWR